MELIGFWENYVLLSQVASPDGIEHLQKSRDNNLVGFLFLWVWVGLMGHFCRTTSSSGFTDYHDDCEGRVSMCSAVTGALGHWSLVRSARPKVLRNVKKIANMHYFFKN